MNQNNTPYIYAARDCPRESFSYTSEIFYLLASCLITTRPSMETRLLGPFTISIISKITYKLKIDVLIVKFYTPYNFILSPTYCWLFSMQILTS